MKLVSQVWSFSSKCQKPWFLHILPKFWAYSGPFRSSNITKHKVKYSNNHLKLFPGDTYKSILVKGSKTLIFAYFANFWAIFGQILRKPDLFWPFNSSRNEPENNGNHWKSFQTISSWKNWKQTIYLKKSKKIWKFFWGKTLGHHKGESDWNFFFCIFMLKMT